MRTFITSRVLMVLALLLTGVPTAPAHGQQISGTFTLAQERSDDVEQAVNRAVSGMNAITRPIARGRLSRTNVPYRRVVISPTPTAVSITTDTRAPIVTPADGGAIKWTREDGEVFDVSTVWENGSLKQTFAAEDGRRVNAYTLSPDGQTLSLQVTVTSNRLRQPLTYQLVFQRERG
jgi:hypothetical protein